MLDGTQLASEAPDATASAEPVGASSVFADTVTRAEPAALITALPADEADLYDLDETRERENAELRERLLRHEIFAEFPRLKGKDTLLYAAAKALDGQLQIRNGSPDEIARVAKLVGKTANELLHAISAEVGQSAPFRTAGVGGGSYPPGHFRVAARHEPKPESFVDTMRRAQFERGIYDVRPSGMSDAEARQIDRERLRRRGDVRPVANV